MPRVRLFTLLPVVLSCTACVPAAPRPAAMPDPPAKSAPAEKPEPVPENIGLLSSQPADPDLVRDFMADYNEADNLRAVFEAYLETLGPATMLHQLEERFPQCHHQAVDLGAALFARTRDLPMALDICGTHCTSACMHGVIREAFGGKSLADVKTGLLSVCEQGDLSAPDRKGSCAHAFGRALMIASGRDTRRALEACTAAPGKAVDYYCATGVYMEYFADPDQVPLEMLLNLHFPCDQHDLYPAACYRYKAPLMLEALGGDAETLARECLGLSGARRLGCFHGLGAAHLQLIHEEPVWLGTICGHGSRDDRIMCIEGAVEKLAQYDADIAREACAFLQGETAEVCKAAAEGKMYRLDKPSLPLYIAH